jgi:hypothetical protein
MQSISEDIWDLELPPIRINKDAIKKQVTRYRMGSVRLALGRIKTREEFEEEKRKILKKEFSKYRL